MTRDELQADLSKLSDGAIAEGLRNALALYEVLSRARERSGFFAAARSIAEDRAVILAHEYERRFALAYGTIPDAPSTEDGAADP